MLKAISHAHSPFANLGPSEEERLKVSKALVDLQIENIRVKEEAEAKAFEQVRIPVQCLVRRV